MKSETHLIRELLPRIDREYRTLARPEAWGICGFSMGGGGALRLTLKHPDPFGAVASLAAAIEKSPDDNEGDNAYRHAAALTPEQRARLRLYLVVGGDDFLFPRHEPFLRHLNGLGLATTFVTPSKVGHDFGKLTELSGDDMIRHLARELKSQSQRKP